MAEYAEVREAVEGAISGALHATDGDMLTRWVLLAEVIEDSGSRAVWCITPEDMKAWDTLGLLTYAQQIEQAGAVVDGIDEL
jgi:hypothetical protein